MQKRTLTSQIDIARISPTVSQDDSTNALPDTISTSAGFLYAGNDTGMDPDGPRLATPVMEDKPKSGLEICVEREAKRLIDEMGSKSIDPDSPEKQKLEQERANSLLKHGYCDE